MRDRLRSQRLVALCVAGGLALRREAAAILATQKGRPAIFNLGHGIVPQTPVEHVAVLMEQVRAT